MQIKSIEDFRNIDKNVGLSLGEHIINRKRLLEEKIDANFTYPCSELYSESHL